MRIEEAIKQKKFKNEYHRAHINLIYTFGWLKDRSSKIFKRFDITSQQYNVLRILKGAYPGVKSAGEIKEVMLDKSPDLTRLIDRMVRKGLVEREFCAENRRKVEIKITDAGIALLKKMDTAVKESESLMTTLTKGEADQLNHLLDKLRGA